MSKLKRLVAFSGLTGLVAAAAFVIPASATSNLKGNCFVDGEAKTEDKDDPNFGVRVTGGEGKFTFEAITLNCTADINKDGVPEPASPVSAKAEGWFDNTVCGTGKALGTVTEILGGHAKYQFLDDEKFGIQFADFVGAFKWHNWDK